MDMSGGSDGAQIFPLFDIVDQLACGVIAACAFEAVGEHGVIVVLAEWLAPPEPHSQKARPVKVAFGRVPIGVGEVANLR